MSNPQGNEWLGMAIGIAIQGALPVYIVLQIWFAIAWKGSWRWAALMPLFIFIPILAYSMLALAHGSNLWPLLAIFFAPIGLGYLAIAAIAFAVINKRAPLH